MDPLTRCARKVVFESSIGISFKPRVEKSMLGTDLRSSEAYMIILCISFLSRLFILLYAIMNPKSTMMVVM